MSEQRLIDANALKEAIKNHFDMLDAYFPNTFIEEIDNAPTVAERPQGKWFEHIDKGLLKARHGNYVLYKVDFLLDNLAREVNIMESVRQMRGDENGKS